MKYVSDEFLVSWAVGAAGFILWATLLAYVATKQLQPIL
jgi:hypothetical protein